MGGTVAQAPAAQRLAATPKSAGFSLSKDAADVSLPKDVARRLKPALPGNPCVDCITVEPARAATARSDT
ncbi:hypothetical protein LBMAG53_36550 [Planctomycetota bacterium]|nr:hypothetical protein LBMAG53_36550 [Planctomycetota bacterium]